MEAGAWFRLADSSTASNGKPESPRPRDPSEIGWRFYRLSADHRSLHWADSPDINSHKIAIGALPASSASSGLPTGASHRSRPPAPQSRRTGSRESSLRRLSNRAAHPAR